MSRAAVWRHHLAWNPFGTVAAVAAIIIGVLGAIRGDDVSQGMTNSLSNSANIVAHLWGLVFAAGGVLSLWGLYSSRSLVEIPGLWMLTTGYGFYSVTVIAGLGSRGVVAGIMAAAISVGCLLKVNIIMQRAHAYSRVVAEQADQGRLEDEGG